MGALEQPVHMLRHRITVDDYHRMATAGILAPDARVELIDGEVIDMAPMKSRHAAAVRLLDRRMTLAVGDAAIVSCQLPLRLGASSEPEPDLLLLRPAADFYAAQHPGPGDVLLLIEVADTSLDYDRRVKLPLYARHGVCEVWIVDLENRQICFFRKPVGDSYGDTTASDTPGPTAVAALPGVTIDLSGLMMA
jgi:Uma2 family endonuclease